MQDGMKGGEDDGAFRKDRHDGGIHRADAWPHTADEGGEGSSSNQPRPHP